jgi:hypothetical protein
MLTNLYASAIFLTEEEIALAMQMWTGNRPSLLLQNRPSSTSPQ